MFCWVFLGVGGRGGFGQVNFCDGKFYQYWDLSLNFVDH